MNARVKFEPLNIRHRIVPLPPGLFCVSGIATDEGVGPGGFQVYPHPPLSPNIEIAGFNSLGQIDPYKTAFLVRITDKPAHILVMDFGEVSIRLKIEQIATSKAAKVGQMSAEGISLTQHREVFELMAHIGSRGDITGPLGSWLGLPGGTHCIEGFCVGATNGIGTSNISYQAILGSDWVSPWFKRYEFCGSRDLELPLLGFRMRLRGAARQTHRLSYAGRFADGASIGPLSDQEFCKSPGMAPLVAIMVDLVPILNEKVS